MEINIYFIIALIIGAIIGGIIAWLLAKSAMNSVLQKEKEEGMKKYNELENDFSSFKATSTEQLNSAREKMQDYHNELASLRDTLLTDKIEQDEVKNKMATVSANYDASRLTIIEKNNDLLRTREELKDIKEERDQLNQLLATATANNEALQDKLSTQKKEVEELGKKFNLEFENIANKLLETKGEKFTELNRNNLKAILEPLGVNIESFKKQVIEVYQKESAERFSLGERVKELALLNKVISEEAQNLTKALKGESKTQGDWGQMILESILEKSGLRKDHEYFLEHQLTGEDGRPLRSDSEGKKMRPDVVIKYPDNRNVIIDSKVSLNAFTRLVECTEAGQQKTEAAAHVNAIKNHILSLSTKGYDDYNKSLDFVMMFIPSEPAYIAALQHDNDLWNFAYEKRILLLSPTNLITSLKLIVDLWKREYQNQNALEIADRGAKLYDKFVGFVENLNGVGDHLDKARNRYDEAFKQLSTGNDNLVLQATKLKNLGLKTKKELADGLVDNALAGSSD
ncbi:MAG: DNA recombination protein RmuC [Ginsengibacter sp.]